jgi:hypothetical protein
MHAWEGSPCPSSASHRPAAVRSARKRVAQLNIKISIYLLYHRILLRCRQFFFYHCFHVFCRFNAFISLLSNYLAHLYHVPSIIAKIGKVRSTLNKLFRTFEPLLVFIPIGVQNHMFVPI